MNEFWSNYFTGEWEIDNKIMESYLSDMVIVSGTARNKMAKVKKSIGGSALYGHTWKTYLSPTKNKTPSTVFKNMAQSKLVDDHPEMAEIFKEFASIYFPDFFYTQVTINKNFPAPAHTDSSNTGVSYLCCFGDYEGGLTAVDYGGRDKARVVKENGRKAPVTFDGSKFCHWVEPWTGNRYSLVFYNNIKNWESKLIEGQTWIASNHVFE